MRLFLFCCEGSPGVFAFDGMIRLPQAWLRGHFQRRLARELERSTFKWADIGQLACHLDETKRQEDKFSLSSDKVAILPPVFECLNSVFLIFRTDTSAPPSPASTPQLLSLQVQTSLVLKPSVLHGVNNATVSWFSSLQVAYFVTSIVGLLSLYNQVNQFSW
jgi:hypothetical protein